MFRIDREANTIARIEAVRFSDLGFREREHLQEWLAGQPDALGEELLIIQKEFAGFDDTKERLDLLAIDKLGALVVIENKLDDSGRDVVWQCLKYASYCSTLTKTNIVEMYQQFLSRDGQDNAQERICEFLGYDDFDEVTLNSGASQRLIMVAAQFRKEVTSTVLWLMKYGISLQCFKATPYRDDDRLFLNIEQVIPLPESKELMIGISAKEKEEMTVERDQAARHVLRPRFWQKTLDALEKAGVDLYQNVGPSRDHWLSSGSGMGGVHYSMIFSKDGVRVELILQSGSKDRNKAMFDSLHAKKAEIEKRFGTPLEWKRLDEKNTSKVMFSRSFDGYDESNWPEMIEWLVEHVKRIESTFSPEIPGLRALKSK
jgi:hypothetical protein